MKLDSLGSGDLSDIDQKVKDMKKEAEDLLNKASKGIEQLSSEYLKCSFHYVVYVKYTLAIVYNLV